MIELPIIDSQESGAGSGAQKYWRSQAQLQGDSEARSGDEFMPDSDDEASRPSRRQFLQLMGASAALAGLTACRQPVEHILPYTRKPEEVIPGLSLFYATAMPFRGVVRPLLVESHEGRPTKVEGNPQHPMSLGTTSAFEQASVLDLYDPDRSQRVLKGGALSTAAEFVAYARVLLAGAGGNRMAVIHEDMASPTARALMDDLRAAYPNLRAVAYNAEGESAAKQGMMMAFGRPLRPWYRFTRESVVVSLDADFLNPADLNFVRNTRDFADSRDVETPEDGMSRLYVAESQFTITGGRADHRLKLRASDVPLFASALAERLGVGGGTTDSRFANHPFVNAAADDLRRAGANGVVIAGETQPAWVHALAAAMNGSINSIGTSMTLLDTGETAADMQPGAFRRLVADMAAGLLDTVLILEANPAYNAPAEMDFAAALARVPAKIHLGMHVDETAALCDWHLPRQHYLENWSDGRAFDGTVSIVQPLIAPLFEETFSELELLNLLATGKTTTAYNLVRSRWQTEVLGGGDFDTAWQRALHDGFVPGTSYPTVAAAASAAPTAEAVGPADGIEVVFRLDNKVLDGRYANNAWMQELPEPVTKIVWGNVAQMSAATAARLGLEVNYDAGRFYADTIQISAGDVSVGPLPVWIAQGHPDDSISVSFGYGRNIKSFRDKDGWHLFDRDSSINVYAQGTLSENVGANVFPIRPSLETRVIIGPKLDRVGGDFLVATLQEHGSMEGRPIVRDATLAEFRANPTFAVDEVELLPEGEPWDEYPALWQDNHPMGEPALKDNLYFKHQWGMSIDLNRCTGCSACVIACQSENNIPVVGKEPAAYGREMHWLRIDRYYTYDTPGEELTDDPRMVVQPLFCVHCENAPCEPVCPVYATTHSPDGISEMTYNRCIGTRYCSNNCPYKVRRFNFFHWSKVPPAMVQMQYNPNVTVRFRGVMEKCNYCVQRIREVNRRTIVEDRPMADGEVLTACQQVCPADAITFGDISNPSSKVVQQKAISRNYDLLAELNTKPRTSYQGLVRNPNPALLPALAETAALPVTPAAH